MLTSGAREHWSRPEFQLQRRQLLPPVQPALLRLLEEREVLLCPLSGRGLLRSEQRPQQGARHQHHAMDQDSWHVRLHLLFREGGIYFAYCGLVDPGPKVLKRPKKDLKSYSMCRPLSLSLYYRLQTFSDGN